MLDVMISKVIAREVIDSRGNPTIEAELFLSTGHSGRAIVPSGASKGEHEAFELRDGDPKRYGGKGVLKAVDAVNTTINQAIANRKFNDLNSLDSLMCELDATNQKQTLGANAILSVSLAFVHALAHRRQMPLCVVLNELMGYSAADMSLPVPLMNILNGGVHANNGLEIQEFMVVPHGFGSFQEALRAGCEVFWELKKFLADKHFSTAVGDEGGFAPTLSSNDQAMEFILHAISKAGYVPGKDVSLALDVAASSFHDKTSDSYAIRIDDNNHATASDMLLLYDRWSKKFPIVSIEDGLDENAWSDWKEFTSRLGKKIQIVGDDLFVTRADRVGKGIDEHVANAVLIKVNQVGTLSETFETMRLCRKSGYRAIVSHRSGETEDATIAHLAVASGCGQIKAGSLSRGERTAKYNELLRIEQWAANNKKPLTYTSPW